MENNNRAMTKEQIYLDLSKCSENELKHLAKVLINSDETVFKVTLSRLVKGKKSDWNTRLFYDEDRWIAQNAFIPTKLTEITYPEFVKLFEDGEENNGWIKIESEADVPKESIQFWGYDKIENDVYSANFRYPTDIGWMIYRFSHYQPIIKPKPPKF